MAKNRHAVVLGRRGGKIGARALFSKLTKEQRSEKARRASLARWARWRSKKKTIPLEAIPSLGR